jgi:5-(carboxyamino)imidazole ribonucleotide synthase
VTPILPGATLGVVGGGQLGRMFATAARRMGYRVAVWSDVADAPALATADLRVAARYDDPAALATFTAGVAAATVEFENLPLATLREIARRVPLRPGPDAIAATSHRVREKEALTALGLPLAPWRSLAAGASLDAALSNLGTPAILKTAGFGYDGKGQVRIHARDAVPAAAYALLAAQPCVLEGMVDWVAELSVVAARSEDGALRAFPVAENVHRNGILDLTLLPARVTAEIASQAVEFAFRVLEGLAYVGVAAVEFFLGRGGELLVNEVAPRPHNSGHVTIEACSVDQFEQQVRALCGLPLGEPTLLAPAAMVNLLGDLWQSAEPDWAAALAVPGVRLHLYGKDRAAVGRKMGHLSAVGSDAAEVVLRARSQAAR